MRVLLVNDLAPGPGSGVEVHLARLADGLRASGDDVALVAGEVVHTGLARALDVWDPRARRLLARRAGAFRPDVVHHHHVVRELSAAVLGVPAGVPQVMTVHDFRLLGDADAATGPVAALKRLKGRLDLAVARRHVDVAIAVSPALADALRAAGFRRVEHLPPFAPDRGPGRPPSSCAGVAFAGRLAPDKGADVLAAAWPRIREAVPGATLTVAGDGPLRAELAALDGVRALGLVADAAAVLAEARVVVVPSVPSRRREGTPTVAIEAALAGRPLVVSDDPGLAAFPARIVEAGDAAALAAAVVDLLRNDDEADRLGAAARAHALDHHTTEAVVAQVRRLYDEVVRR